MLEDKDTAKLNNFIFLYIIKDAPYHNTLMNIGYKFILMTLISAIQLSKSYNPESKKEYMLPHVL